MKTLRFGIEIETIAPSREAAASAVASVVGGLPEHRPDAYGTWAVRDSRGREWKVVRDSSVRAIGSEQAAEVVSPPLAYEDIEELQRVVRALREAGCRVDPSCGVHVHVDAASLDAAALARLARLVWQREELIVQALGVQAGRLRSYTRTMGADFGAALARPTVARSTTALRRAWYGGDSRTHEKRQATHYDSSRYSGLNLHSVWYRKTVEFRWFEGSLHAGEIRADIVFCLALVAMARDAKAASARKRREWPNPKFQMRTWLIRLGLVGDEFKAVRHHLLKWLPGDGAWRHGRHRGMAEAPVAATTREPEVVPWVA